MFEESFKLHADEKIITYIRRHWIFLVIDFLHVFFIFLLPAIGIWVVQALNIIPQFEIFNISLEAFLNILLYMWAIFCWLLVAEKFTDYSLDFWILTNKRIIESELIKLFHRRLSTLELQDIEDITIENLGLISNYFGYGTLEVQTAGAKREFFAERIANPEIIQRLMFDAKVKDEEEKKDIEKQEVEQISHRVIKETKERDQENHDFHIPKDQKVDQNTKTISNEIINEDENLDKENIFEKNDLNFDWAYIAERQANDIRNVTEKFEDIEDKYKRSTADALRIE